MPRYFAFLRAINVGGRNVTMEQLRGHFTDLGFSAVESFIASGNIIFSSRTRAIPALRTKIEGGLKRVLGYAVSTFIRTEEQVASIHCHRPFPAAEMQAAHGVYVGLMAEPPTAAAARELLALNDKVNRFHVNGSEVYWLGMPHQDESTVSMAAMERALGAPATFRNLNTIARLVAKYELGPR
ncbi:MAG: DUF1697 domain-containing protein [Gemmatimonadota bacterium]